MTCGKVIIQETDSILKMRLQAKTEKCEMDRNYIQIYTIFFPLLLYT